MKRFDVISIGSATFDVFLKSKDFKIIKTSRFATGIAICQSYGSKIEVEEMVLSTGGGGTNTAVGFSRLGLKTAVVARCGDDVFGSLVIEDLKKEGVDTSFVIHHKDEATDYASILLGRDGGRTIFVYRGETRLEIRSIPFEKLDAKWIYLASLEGNLKIVEKIIKMKKNFQGIAFNPGLRELKQKWVLRKFFHAIDVLIWNKEEAEEFLGKKLEERKFWREVNRLGPKIIAITDGRNGAYLFNNNKYFLSPAFNSADPKDETGAGDAFGSGFVAGLIKGWSIEKSFSLGLANGASAVREIGAKTALLKSSEIDKWLKKTPRLRC